MRSLKTVKVVLIVLLLILSISAKGDSSRATLGFGLVGDIDKAGLLGRLFIDDHYGFTVKAGVWYGEVGYFGLTEFTYIPPVNSKIVPTVTVGYGYDRYDLDTLINRTRTVKQLEISSFRTSLGALVRSHRYELSMDIGYRFGEAQFGYSYSPIGDNSYIQDSASYRLPPFTMSVTYTVYVGKRFKK